MKTLFKILCIALLVPLSITANNSKGKYKKTKTVTKEYNVNANATLELYNKYGNVDVTTWNENRTVITVTITTTGNNESKVEKRLDLIHVDFDATANRVYAKTSIENRRNSWSLWGNNNNVSMNIHYQVKMPVSNHIIISNKYGGITIDKLDGSTDITCKYGKLYIGELRNSKNEITIDYTRKSQIDFMESGSIDADYSTLHIDSAGKTQLNADYSNLSFGTITQLNYNCDYGSLKIESVEKLEGNSDYMHLTANQLLNTANVDMDYGGLKIYGLGANFKQLKVDGSYASIKIGVQAQNTFNFKINLKYGRFKHGNGFTTQKEIVKNSSKYYEGYYNKANSNTHILIKSNYGSITFFNN